MPRQPTAKSRRAARRALDRRFAQIRITPQAVAPPRAGWVRAIRESLGMSASDLGERMGTSHVSVLRLEKNEREGSVGLETLGRAADALDCDLVYVLVPRRPLDVMVAEQAEAKARAVLVSVGHSMLLEDQQVSPEVAREQLAEQAAVIADEPGLWSRD